MISSVPHPSAAAAVAFMRAQPAMLAMLPLDQLPICLDNKFGRAEPAHSIHQWVDIKWEFGLKYLSPWSQHPCSASGACNTSMKVSSFHLWYLEQFSLLLHSFSNAQETRTRWKPIYWIRSSLLQAFLDSFCNGREKIADEPPFISCDIDSACHARTEGEFFKTTSQFAFVGHNAHLKSPDTFCCFGWIRRHVRHHTRHKSKPPWWVSIKVEVCLRLNIKQDLNAVIN